jgi:uncharacterized protein YdaU (DUF1376 family)
MNFPRLNLHVGDYLQRTTHLRPAQQGAFSRLVLHYWGNGGLPQEDEQLATIACMDLREWKKHKPVLEHMFEVGWRLPWLDADLTDAAAARDRRSKAGKAGNEKRWGGDRHVHADRQAFMANSKSDPNANAMASLPHASPHGNGLEQGKTYSEESSVIGAGVVPLRRSQA